jgi:hypothetical protein
VHGGCTIWGTTSMTSLNCPEDRPLKMTEAFKTATLLDGLVPIELDGVTATRYECPMLVVVVD